MSPIGTLTLTTSNLDDCYANKHSMNILSSQENTNSFSLICSDLSFDSPGLSQSPSIYSCQSSLNCSPRKNPTISKSIDIKNSSLNSKKILFENTIQTPTSNDTLFDSLNGASFSVSFDKISNCSFMDYFNIPDSYCVSPLINTDCFESRENELELGNGCLYSTLSNNNNSYNNSYNNNSCSDENQRKKKISFSPSWFPNLDELDFEHANSSRNENIKFLGQYENEKIRAEKLVDLSDLNMEDSSELNQIDNHDTLVAIREMAIRERRSQQRKHKNSTSSVSSTSMSSRIKKFAIDLQNTTNNINIENQNFKPVPIYTSSNNCSASSATTNSSTIIPKSSLKIEYFLNNLPDHDQADLDFERFNIDVDDTDLSQFLTLDGWEQMLDEDCISRLTTDFGTQNFATKRSNIKAESLHTLDNSAQDQSISENKLAELVQMNSDQVESSLNTISNPMKLPSRTVVNSGSSLSTIQHLSKSTSTQKTQPLVVVLSSKSSKLVNSKSSPSISLNDVKSTKQLKQIVFEHGPNKKCQNSIDSINQALNITNSQIKKLNISEKLDSNFDEKQEKKNLENYSPSLNKPPSEIKNLKNNNNTSDDNQLDGINCCAKQSELQSSMSSSFIDTGNELMNCINPDQIFPYRMAGKKDENFSAKSWTKTNTNLENNLKTEHFDEEDEEEIDVVSINQNNTNSLSFNGNSNSNNMNAKVKTSLDLARDNNCVNALYASGSIKELNNSVNLNHHNYYHQPSSMVAHSNKKTNINLQNKSVCQQNNQQSSLLAKCLKSSSSNIKSDVYPRQDNTSNKFTTNFAIVADKKTSSFNNIPRATNSNDSGVNISENFSNTKNSLNLNNTVSGGTISSSLSKSLSSPFLKKSANFLFNTVNLDQSKKSIATISSSNGQIVNKSSTNLTNSLSARNLSQKSSTNPIRILTTSINNSNSVIRQINQTTTLCTKPTSILTNGSVGSKAKSSNIIHIPTQKITNHANLLNNSVVSNFSNVFTKNCKNLNKSKNESKVITTTLIAKPQMNNKISNTNLKQINDNIKFGSASSSSNTETNQQLSASNSIDAHNFNDFKQNFLIAANKSERSEIGEFDEGSNTSNKLKNFIKKDLEFGICAQKSDFQIEMTDESDDVDDDDEDDEDNDDDEYDEQSCTITSPLQTNSNNLSQFSLTSSGHSNASSDSCSTPIKIKSTKTKLNANSKLMSELTADKRFESKVALNEKFRYKKKRKNKQIGTLGGGVANASSIRKNNRLNILGYSNENPAEKRAFHILSERQRRNDLKKLFETLRTNIPNLCDKQKASKLTILKAAVDHLMEVSNKKEKLNVIFDKEKQKNAILMQNLKNLQQSFNTPANNSISSSNCFSHSKTNSANAIATLFVH